MTLFLQYFRLFRLGVAVYVFFSALSALSFFSLCFLSLSLLSLFSLSLFLFVLFPF